ncbi:DUF6481 family protein [Sedimentitalea sp.]|uniref:DUF6481 family protein n=1 Tax=Sedimentitalea sp. TaxID=2048915 RepID=UPI0032978B6D
MKNSNGDRFDGRLKTASQAKQKQLERFTVAANDPEKLAKRAERDAVGAAREAQRKAKAAKLMREKKDLERQQAEAAEHEAAQTKAREAELDAEGVEAAEREIAQEAADQAARKAERDRRYAARRNRKR